jgi:type II secretory ATPase GspE/PulE/Tfp pilus assembly ATPase PilB-like protein
MEVTPDIRRLVHHAAPSHELRDALHRQDILSLREEGVLLAQEGKSSLEEILAVTHSEDLTDEPMGETVESA